ncbi:MAG TPA: hypothetical protein VEZ40_21130 [Pyrinomonadaceae bacterium]|nr:hypothetical protein [Pyrinomonadaceae bacterium]
MKSRLPARVENGALVGRMFDAPVSQTPTPCPPPRNFSYNRRHAI